MVGTITTVAGGGNSRDDRVAATSAYLHNPAALAVNAAGELYIAESGRVRKVDASGTITTVAGGGSSRDDGVAATSAYLQIAAGYTGRSNPLAVNAAGELYIAVNSVPHSVREVDASGTITTVAGGGSSRDDGVAATSAALNNPSALAVNTVGELYIAESGRVRKVDTSGTITTVAGGGSSRDDGVAATSAYLEPTVLAVNAAGDLYILSRSRVRKVDASGTITTVAGGGSSRDDGVAATSAYFNNPAALAVNAAGELYIAESGRVRKVDASGTITTVAGGGSSRDDGVAATSANLEPTALAVNAAGDLYILSRSRVRKVSLSSGGGGIQGGPRNIETVAGTGVEAFGGDGGPAAAAQLVQPTAVAVDAAGNLYVADFSGHRVRKMDAAGVITTAAGTGTSDYRGDYGPATSANIFFPFGVAVDSVGNLYVADTGNHSVRKVDRAGVITTVAGTGFAGYGGDGGPALSASLASPFGVAVDGVGNLYIADTGNQRVRRVDLSGNISTVVGTGSAAFAGDGGPAASAALANPLGVAVDGAGNVYIADTDNQRVRRVDHSSGDISTVAGTGSTGFAGDGGPALSASLASPVGIALDGAGNLYIADSVNQRVRRVDHLTSIISTVAGTGDWGFAGDGGPGVSAILNYPLGVAVDGTGNLYIADTGNHRVRKVGP